MIYETKNEIINDTGFLKPKIKYFGKDQHWTMGANQFYGEVIHEDGQWSHDVEGLELEVQNKYCETMHCWIWNTIKAVTVVIFSRYGIKTDYSERFSGVMGGAGPNGGSPHEGCETVRKNGLLKQELLPWTPDLNTFWKFSSPRPMTASLISEASKWLLDYDFCHDWVVYPSIFSKVRKAIKGALGFFDINLGGMNNEDYMMFALKYSPLGCSVLAWQTDSNGYAYCNSWQQHNHWTMIVGYVKGQYWIVYDSYTNCWRKLRWNYGFRYVKRYGVVKKTYIDDTATAIKNEMFGQDIKGDESGEIWYIWDGQKHSYINKDNYDKVHNAFGLSKKCETLPQGSVDLVPEGIPMDYERLKTLKREDWSIIK